MERPNYLEQAKKYIKKSEPGTIFLASDFSNISDNKTMHMCLTRLVEQGMLKKVARGIYMKQNTSKLLGTDIPASPYAVAEALARNYGWNIVPSELAALNIVGLSTQVPNTVEYISDGPYKEYKVKGTIIKFKHTNKNTEITSISPTAAIYIRAIKAYGQERITDETIDFLSNTIPSKDKEILLRESKYSTSWIYETIKKVCKEV